MTIQLILTLIFLGGFIVRVIACFRKYNDEVKYYTTYPNFFNPYLYKAPTQKDLMIWVIFSLLWPLIILVFPFNPNSFFQYFYIGKSDVKKMHENKVQEEIERNIEIDDWIKNHIPSRYIKYSYENGDFIFPTSQLSKIIGDQSNFILKWAELSNKSISVPVSYPDFAPDIRIQVYELAVENMAMAYCKECQKQVQNLKLGNHGGTTDYSKGYAHFKGQTYDALFCENDHILLTGKEGPRFF